MPHTRALLFVIFSGFLFAQSPIVTAVQNNYGRAASPDSSYGIAQGSIFIVKGTNLSSQVDTTLQNAPLQTTLAGVRVRITVAGTTYYAPLYYVLSTQIAAVLPSNVPASANNANNATVIIEKGTVTSAAFSFKVVKSAFGMLAWDGETGNGRAIIVRYPSGSLAGVSPTGTTNVLNPGDIILLFGSGLGPGPVAEDSAPPNPVDMTGIPISITIGGVSAQVLYRGRSTYVGLDQISLVVPTLASYSCDVSMLISTNGVQANPTTIPIAGSGSTCTNPTTGGGSGDGGTTSNPLSQAEIDRIVAQGTYRSGKLTIARLRSFQTINGQPSNLANDSSQAAFTLQSGPDLRKQLEGQLADGTPFSPGTCKFYANQLGLPPYNITTSYLDAGTSVTLQGPAGSRVLSKGTQTYNAQTGNTTPGNFNDPGRYTFTVPGGRDVGAFSLAVDLRQT